MSYIFGPVPSRRLGLSLGVDLIPPKTCTYDCLYCEVGKTTCHTIETGPFVSMNEIAAELEKALLSGRPDTITLAGSGEPTLNSEIDSIISLIKKRTDIPIAILTNGSLFWKEEVRARVLGADMILPTLSTVFEDTHRIIHRPCHGLDLPAIIRGIKDLRMQYNGLIFLEVILLAGINDTEKEIEGLKRAIEEISPDRIQLNTVIRPPSNIKARPVSPSRMEEIKNYFGDMAQIIAYSPAENKTEPDPVNSSIIEMAKRRPVRMTDIAQALNITNEETMSMLKDMIRKGEISERPHEGEIFYVAAGKDLKFQI
jgi:wyosine [tRNA(Phe)-imidazoG37] synthetase (radical SAM superfamily)